MSPSFNKKVGWQLQRRDILPCLLHFNKSCSTVWCISDQENNKKCSSFRLDNVWPGVASSEDTPLFPIQFTWERAPRRKQNWSENHCLSSMHLCYAMAGLLVFKIVYCCCGGAVWISNYGLCELKSMWFILSFLIGPEFLMAKKSVAGT